MCGEDCTVAPQTYMPTSPGLIGVNVLTACEAVSYSFSPAAALATCAETSVLGMTEALKSCGS